MMEDTRPTWLRRTIAAFFGWHAFWLGLIILMAGTLLIIEQVFPGHTAQWPGIVVLIACLIISGIITIKIVKLQNRILQQKSKKTNYIVLAVLIILSLLSMPSPFIYTVF